MKITDWHGAYDNGWKGLITGESFAHPAKFSRGLIFRIVEYLLKSEMVKPGDTVIDPFGGVGLGALPCLLNGLNWIGNELEEKFVELGRKNIELWNSKFASMPRWTGQAVLLQGDSRKLAEVIQQAGGLVSSPPYVQTNVGNDDGDNELKRLQRKAAAGQLKGEHLRLAKQGRLSPNEQANLANYGTTPGQLASLPEGKPVIVASPPYAGSVNQSAAANDTEARIERMRRAGIDVTNRANVGGGNGVARQAQTYGSTTGQLGAMPEGRPAVVTSPPFAGNSGGRGEASRNGIDPALFDRHQGAMVGGIGSAGNLAGLKPGALVSSPPFEDNEPTRDDKFRYNGKPLGSTGKHYGTTDGQLGTESGETFWSAARLILEQCHQLLPPGAPAVFVVKSFVRDGQIVDFPGQWQALCEACGFETVEIIRAWLVKDKGTQMDLNGNGIKQRVERKSFFRRTGEQNSRAKKHWQMLSRDDQARLLRVSHTALWADYWSKLNTDKPVPRPNRGRILRNAQAGAYARDGKPHYEIETAIDYEVVLITRRLSQ